jgi:hypothetical protein
MFMLKADGMAKFVQNHPLPVGWKSIRKLLEIHRRLIWRGNGGVDTALPTNDQ